MAAHVVEGEKDGKRKDRRLGLNSKEKTEGGVWDRNKRISVNHPSPALCLYLDITLRRTEEDKKHRKQFFINRVRQDFQDFSF